MGIDISQIASYFASSTEPALYLFNYFLPLLYVSLIVVVAVRAIRFAVDLFSNGFYDLFHGGSDEVSGTDDDLQKRYKIGKIGQVESQISLNMARTADLHRKHGSAGHANVEVSTSGKWKRINGGNWEPNI